MKFIDLTGQRFGKLMVVSKAPGKGKGAQWNCICDCGGKKITSSKLLKGGEIKRCKSCMALNFKDLTGKRFGKLIVISIIRKEGKHIRWSCICDCGKKVKIYGTSLNSGRSKSCGCIVKSKPEKLIDKKFNSLLVISRNIIDNNSKIFYNCLCDCGKTTVVPSSNLKSGEWKSCGCLRKYSDRTKPAKNRLYRRYKRNAWKRDIDFDLNFEDFINLTQQNCFYCGKKPSQYYSYYNTAEKFFYNGIDRLDSSGKYERSNVVPCCKECNYLKWDRTKEEFINWLKCVTNNKIKTIHDNTLLIAGSYLSENTISSQHSLYWVYKNSNSKYRGYSFDINFEKFIDLTQQNCFYCGISPNRFFQKRKSKEGFFYNGLDRIDNTKGYELLNVVSCCKKCNESKSKLTQKEFYDHIKKCYEYLNLGYEQIDQVLKL